MKKRALSLLLCLVMVLGFFPAGIVSRTDAAIKTGYVTDNLVLHLDANNNTGSGYDPNATTWKNLASGGEQIKINGQAWGTDATYGTHYLNFNENYILLPDSVRQALSGTEFTIEFVLDNFVDGGSGINNIMCVTGADSYISQFVANGGEKNPGAVVNDNFVIFAWAGSNHSFRTCYGTNPWSTINNYASIGNSAVNQKTNTLTFSSTAGSKWYQDGTQKASGSNAASGKTITLDGYLENGVWQTANLPQIAFGAATDVVADRHFKANVRSIRIYADTLTADEMKQNAAQDNENFYTEMPDPNAGYVTDNLVLHLDANNNTGIGYDGDATTWKNLAGNGEMVKVGSHSWGTDADYGTHYLDMDGYIILPEAVRQAIASGVFTIEFVMDDYVGEPTNTTGDIVNLMALTGSDRWIAATTTKGSTPNDNFVIYQHSGEKWARFKTNSTPAHADRAMVGGGVNGKTQTITYNSGSVVWYQDTVSVDSSTGYNAVPNVSTFTGAQSGEVPQVIFGAATDTVSGRAFSGKVRAIRVYKDILTADEIKKNAEKDQNYHYGPVGYDEGYVSRNLILHLDANNNTGSGYDPNATTWKNLANGGENIKLNGQTWGSEQLYDSNYLTFTDDYILLPDSVRQALAGTEFTIEFVLDNFQNGSSGINNIMCVTGADSYIAKFKANGGTMNAGSVVNDNFVIWSNVNQAHNLRTYYGTGSWSAINAYATVANDSLNEKTNTLQFSSTAGNKWYQDGTLIHSGKNSVSGKTMTLDGYLEEGVWQTANLPQIAFGAATDVVANRHFNANVRAIRIYAGTLTEAEIAKNAALDAEKYYTVDEDGMDALAQESWNAVVGGTTALDSNTTLAGIQAYAESKLQSNLISVTVADAGNGAFTFTYKLKSTGETIDTHTLYVDTEYTLDMAQLTSEQQTALMNDLAKFSGSGTIAVKWDDTAKAVNYTGTRNGNPVSHLYFPVYQSNGAYVYEAEISFVSGGSGWSAMTFGADQTLEHMQYAFWGSAGATATGAEIVRFQNPANHGGTFAVGHVNTGMDTVVAAMGDKWEDTYTYNSTKKTYTVTDTVTYKVVVYEKTVYAFIDGTQVLMAPVSGTLYKELNGVFGFNTSETSMNIHKLSVRPITEDNEAEELAGINLRFNPVKSYRNDIYEPDTDVNTAPIVMQSADADTKDVSELAKRPSALIFDLKVEEGVLKAYDGETLLGNFADLYALNQPKTNVGVRLTLGDTDTADALIQWALANRAGNLWAISNDVELLERITDQVNVIRGVVDFTGDVVRGPSDVTYEFDTDGDGTIEENANVTDATLGKVDVAGGEYADKTAPIFTYENYTGGYEALEWCDIYDIVITCGHRNVLLPERVIDKEYVYYLQGSLITVFVETDATTDVEFYDLIATGVNGILSTEFDTNIAVLESDIFDVNGEELNVRGGHVVGHRGDMGYHVLGEATLPENSIESIVSGAQSGAASVEFDVYMTKDGELVLNHNTSIKGFFVYAEDCPLTPEQRISEDVTIVNRYWKGDLEYMVSTYNPNIKMQRLYQLYEAVDTEYPELRLHHEMKDTRIETQNRIIDLMTQYGLRDRSDMMSTNYAAIQYSSSMGISSQYLSTPSAKDTPDRIYEAEASYRPVNSTWHTQWPSIDTDYLEELKHYGETAYPWATYASTYAARYVQGYQGFTTDAPHHTDDIIRLLTPAYDLDTGKVSVVARTLAYHEPGVFNNDTISGEAPIRLPAYLEGWWEKDPNHSHYVSDQANEYDLTGFEVLALSGGEKVEISGDTVTFKEGTTGDAVLVVRYKQALDNQSSFYIYSNTMTVSAGKITGYDVTANDPATYDGTAKASATVTEGKPADATITFAWTEGGQEQTSATVPSFTEVGKYTVSYTISKPNYADVTGSYEFEIKSAGADALNVVAKGVEKVYDGAAAAPSVTAIDGATVEYSTDNQTWSTTAPSYTDVVETTVYYRVSKTGYETATGAVTVKITEATITGYKVESNGTVKFDGTEKASATVTTGTPVDATITYTVGNDTSNTVPKFSAVGTYEVSYTISKTNYTPITGKYTFTIEEGDITGYEVKANDPATYDGSAKVSATVTAGTPADAEITYTYKGNESDTIPEFTEAGSYEVSYAIWKPGYKDATGSYTFTINNAAASALNVVAKGVEKVYDGAAAAPSVTAIDGAAVEYSTDNQTWSATAPSFTDVVDTTVYYRVSKTNYDTATGSVTVKITEATITGYKVEANGTVEYDGTEKTSATVTTGTPADATITYTVGNDTFNEVPKFTTVGKYTVSYTISKANYADVTGSYEFEIEKGAITGYKVEANDTAKYNGTEKTSATVTTGIPADAKITYTVGNDTSNEVPKFTAVGKYTVSYTISKDGYNDVTGSYEFEIEKGDITGFEIKANDTAKYDGTEKTSATVAAGTPADATITYTVGNDTSNTVPKFTAVGKYTVSYTISKDGYNDVTGSYRFTIEKAEIEVDMELFDKAEATGEPVPVAKVNSISEGAYVLFAQFKNEELYEAYKDRQHAEYPFEKIFGANEIPAFTEPGVYYLAVYCGGDNYKMTDLQFFTFELTEPAPETGDSAAIGLWLTMLTLSAAAGAILVLRRKREQA